MTLGVGGVLAGLTFYYYRQDRKDMQAQFAELYKEVMTMNALVLSVVRENTAAFTQNAAAVESLHAHMVNGHRLPNRRERER
jgi:hypothetical protein